MSASAKLRRTRKQQAGYTLVELMMALALFTVGILGIVSLQKLMVVSTAHAKNVSVAERVAQSWASQLQLDSLGWQQSLMGVNWLGSVGTGWVRPAYVGGVINFGAAFDAVGNPLSDGATDLARARYCAHLRLTSLYADAQPTVGNGMMRAEVRVFWLRDGEANISASGICEPSVNRATIGEATDRYHFVYHTTGVRQHPSVL